MVSLAKGAPSARMAVLAVGLAFLVGESLAACGTSSRPPHPRSSPQIISSPTATPSPLPSPSIGTTSCRLPLYGSGLSSPGAGSPAGGFLQLPGGGVSPAAGTSLTEVAGSWQTTGSPHLTGDEDEESWDYQLSRWLPASPAEISPSGTQYAYAAGASGQVQVHLVTPASGADNVLIGESDYQVLGWQGEQILLVAAASSGSGTEGLYLLNPGTGAVRELQPQISTVSWYLVGGGAVWGVGVNAADPSPPPTGSGDELLRYDEATGALTTWSYQPGLSILPVGVTGAGDPVEVVEGTSQTLVQLATAPAAATRLLQGAGLDSLMPLEVTSSFSDAHGTWLSTDSGLYLLTPQSQLLLEQTGNFTNAEVVGPCD